ncbi:type II secretion system GspH family protein [Pseudoalteromonas sp. C2R02]|uniref:PulJ/GspJ family protein n=1 Tax=Pseudoalteromonas sp. C2R02 TaxID=2841565 RepID=UPI001C099EF4|nr:type II secretion system protein [Pseudoalteromonas sp. C2R02]MBU2972644.1 type II secretion system GspH family protein [Pseudoalteromonas sp. C2R02]
MLSQKNRSGFTLVELLIAITIVSLLLFTGSYSYSIISERWNKQLGQFNVNLEHSKKLALLQRVLEGIHPHVIVDSKQSPSFFFIGATDSLLAVSRSGFYSRTSGEIFRLESLANENGSFDLIYQASLSDNLLLKGTDQNITFDTTQTLFQNLDKVEFSYYGWASLNAKSASTTNLESWYTSYSGIDRRYTPSKFELVLTQQDKTYRVSIALEQEVSHWLSPYINSDS